MSGGPATPEAAGLRHTLREAGYLLRPVRVLDDVHKVAALVARDEALEDVGFDVAKRGSGLGAMPSVNARRMLRLKSGRGCKAVISARSASLTSWYPMPSTSYSTPAVSRATSGSMNSGMPGVVCTITHRGGPVFPAGGHSSYRLTGTWPWAVAALTLPAEARQAGA
jgi:hypothetical protein